MKAAPKVSVEFIDGKYIKEQSRVLEEAQLKIMISAGKQVYEMATIMVSFDLVRDEFIREARRNTAKLITGITADTKRVVRRIMEQSIENGWRAIKTAKTIQKVVGMNERQLVALDKFEQKLVAQGLTPTQVAYRVARERAKKVRYRSLMISRTEASRARSDGTLLVYRKDGRKLVRYATAASPCIVCEPFDGMVFTLDEAWNMIPLHPNCLCSWIPYIEDILAEVE